MVNSAFIESGGWEISFFHQILDFMGILDSCKRPDIFIGHVVTEYVNQSIMASLIGLSGIVEQVLHT